MGHATRCIPIARKLQQMGHNIDFASDGPPRELLKLEFPEVRHHLLPSYKITYPTKSIILNVGRKLGSFFLAIKNEHKKVKELVTEYKYDVIISDNRFGCYSPQTKNIFITHQINIITPTGVLDPAIRTFNYRLINKFDQCWVPDFKEFPGLSGVLGHNHTIKNCAYLGPISRMKKLKTVQKYKYAAILSGPEPQRTKLEKEVYKELLKLKVPSALVSGVVNPSIEDLSTDKIDHFPFLTSNDLNQLICSTEMIVCRSGYTSIMDLAKLGKKAICIPTPGQTEQEYLAKLYEEKKFFPHYKQGTLDIQKASKEIDGYTGISLDSEDRLHTVLLSI